MTFSVLRALHGIIGEALDNIEAVYALHASQDRPLGKDKSPYPSGYSNSPHSGTTRSGHRSTLSVNSLSDAYASPPPSPCIKTEHSDPDSMPQPSIDFPSLDAPCDSSSIAEALTQHPDVVSATNRIIAACGQMTATVQTPFLTICDAVMGYHLPSCMRLFEASHTPEILREAGSAGSHVCLISEKNGVDKVKLAHILRLLATHHVVRELSPDVFALNRVSSMIDTGKRFQDVQQWTAGGVPEKKYEGTSGTAAFVGLCADEIFKSSAYLTETYLLSQSKITKAGSEPTRAPFCFAFGTVESRIGFFGWLEGHAELNSVNNLALTEDVRVETSGGAVYTPVKAAIRNPGSVKHTSLGPSSARDNSNSNRFRLERFGKAMSGTCSWEAPGAILNSFDWHSLAQNSVIVDVGGGIGSTSMLLASAFSSLDKDGLDLRFIIQDRPIVVEMGEKAWKAKCPEFLENGTALFQAHDFFTPQPVKQAAVFLLRVVLHDWPDDFARRILIQLREAAMPDTKLLLGDFVLPLACPDETDKDELLEGIQGAESMLASPPLLANLGKASANAYWMDLTMQVMFNAQERTLRETVALAASAGWKVTRVTKCGASHFGYIVAVPAPIPSQIRYQSGGAALYRDPSFVNPKSQASLKGAAIFTNNPARHRDKHEERDLIERSSSRCGTPTFGSRMQLSFVEEALARFGSAIRSRKPSAKPAVPPKPTLLKQAITLAPVPSVKKKSSPLSVPPLATSPSPVSPTTKGLPSPKFHLPSSEQRAAPKRMSLANLRIPFSSEPVPPLPIGRVPPSPMSPIRPLPRRSSIAQLSSPYGQQKNQPTSSLLASPSLVPIRHVPEPGSLLNSRQGSLTYGIPIPTSPSKSLHRRGSEREPQVQLPMWKSPSRPAQQSQHRTMTRRASLAQLQMPSSSQRVPSQPPPQAAAQLRKRTKSAAGLSSRTGQRVVNAATPANRVNSSHEDGLDNCAGVGSSQWGALPGRGGGTSLRSEKGREVAMAGGFPELLSLTDINLGASVSECDQYHTQEDQGDSDSEYGPVNVLAAAARIERGDLRKRDSP
ncbi:hypothetical protein P691DRAFT_776367 [Macrolepiota fuliginosa MF-IS2]|uniref:O-methyltransferase C-terminal domain-containing protein n=1 Tax=Macrolepiota fuliginosa MF-IS2 TaxID=1400762 RepID=A0A9P6C0A2_9AGAR|nr:hypothetical protein P691DRAFT_776367 [Macrolepiota fuliginosa MF-IS2]